MPKVTVQVRTHNNLLELLAAGKSPAWVVGRESEDRITHVQVVNFEGTQMIEGIFDRTGCSRDADGKLTISFLDGRIVNCKITFAQNPVHIFDEQPGERS